MSKVLFLLAALWVVLPVASVWGDDTAFGGEGVAPIPIKQSEIRMVDEHVVIKGEGLDRAMGEGRWAVTCDFTFHNTSDKPQKVLMGFPFPRYGAEEDVPTADGGSAESQVKDFKVLVRGVPVSTTKKKTSPNPQQDIDYDTAYIWDVEFAPDETVKIHHTYTTALTYDAGGHTFASYVLKTGGLWKGGTIGKALIELIPGVRNELCSEAGGEFAYIYKTKPFGMKKTGSGTDIKYIWDISNLKPNEDLDVCIYTPRDYVRSVILQPVMWADAEENSLKLDLKKVRILRNTVFAMYGRTFSDPDLKKYFESQWWYAPNPSYSDSMLTSEDHKIISEMTRLEAQLKK